MNSKLSPAQQFTLKAIAQQLNLVDTDYVLLGRFNPTTSIEANALAVHHLAKKKLVKREHHRGQWWAVSLTAAGREWLLKNAPEVLTPAPVPTSEPEPAPMVDRPATYPMDFEVTTMQRNYILNHMVFSDMNYPKSHVIRIFSPREHARFNQCLEEVAANPPQKKGKIGDSNVIPPNTSGKWQLWQFLFGWRLVSEHETEAEANVASGEIYNGRVVEPEPMVDQPQPLPATTEDRIRIEGFRAALAGVEPEPYDREFPYAEKFFSSQDETRRAEGKPVYGETYEVTFDSNSIPDYRPTLVLIFLTETNKGYFCKHPDRSNRLFIKHTQNPKFSAVETE